MKALIMAAGYGRRLEPLTIAVPKPMVPIVNLPTMQHNIELLRKHDFKTITANIHYHPEQIQNYFGDGSDFGVSLAYSYEKELLGTAGGVKRMARIAELKSSFLVLSSDALTDLNLRKIFDHHKRKKALVTIALAKVEEVEEFGVVLMNENGKVIGFQEKPKQAEAKSDLVNTGIYVMEPEALNMIPEGFYDFGKDLFPRLVEQGAPVYGYQMVEYWNDVGSLGKYIRSNYDAMRGAVRIKIPGKKVAASSWIGERERIDRSARFEGSVIVGDSCVIGRDVYIRDSVIGDKCVIEDGASILGSVVWSDSIIEKGAQVTQSVLGSWCLVGERSKINEGSIFSNRCFIRRDSDIPPNSRFEPNSLI